VRSLQDTVLPCGRCGEPKQWDKMNGFMHGRCIYLGQEEIEAAWRIQLACKAMSRFLVWVWCEAEARVDYREAERVKTPGIRGLLERRALFARTVALRQAIELGLLRISYPP
jgi:hypothetical protein